MKRILSRGRARAWTRARERARWRVKETHGRKKNCPRGESRVELLLAHLSACACVRSVCENELRRYTSPNKKWTQEEYWGLGHSAVPQTKVVRLFFNKQIKGFERFSLFGQHCLNTPYQPCWISSIWASVWVEMSLQQEEREERLSMYPPWLYGLHIVWSEQSQSAVENKASERNVVFVDRCLTQGSTWVKCNFFELRDKPLW